MKINISTIRRINIVAVAGLSTTCVVWKALSTDETKKKTQLKIGDKIVQVPQKVQSLIDEVCKEMKFEKTQYKISPFMSKDSDVKCIGYPIWDSEVTIAIPEYYMYDENENENASFSVVVDNKEIPKNTPEFITLKQAMSLSKEAKKFGLAHELYQVQHSILIPYAITPLFFAVQGNVMSYILDMAEKRIKKGKSPHISNHFMIFLIAAWLYVAAFDVFNVHKEFDSDFKAAALGKSYIKGGIEYYEKMMKRNKTFKELNKKADYTENGDLNTDFIRKQHMPLKERIAYLTELSEGKKVSVWKFIFLKN